jgi:hypothetical protein
MAQLNSESHQFHPDALFQENVEILANYLYICRGCKEGHALNNWLEAEQQLRESLFLPIQSRDG